ncbi:MAG: endopeptidase La, partial [Chlamydiia bacterium]|nr:endopeptidase La [Chlamydiia bacterium]
MAAPLVIEPGHYYEVLKNVAKSEHKSMGLFLTKQEDASIYKAGYKDLYDVGVLARILRIIPMEQGGAQVVLNMERRISIKKPAKTGKFLKAQISYHQDGSS